MLRNRHEWRVLLRFWVLVACAVWPLGQVRAAVCDLNGAGGDTATVEDVTVLMEEIVAGPQLCLRYDCDFDNNGQGPDAGDAAVLLMAAQGRSALACDPRPANRVPVISPSAQVVSGQQGAPLRFVLEASDNDGDPLTWQTQGALPAGLGFQNGVLEGTPETAGEFPFTVTVNDGQASAQAQLTLQIAAAVAADPVVSAPTSDPTPPPAPPASPPPPLVLVAQQASAVYLQSFSWTAPPQVAGGVVMVLRGTLPLGLVFSQGVLTGAPRQFGVYSLSAFVRAGEQEGEYPLTLTVLTQPAITWVPRVVQGQTGQSLALRFNATDPGGDPLSWSHTGTLPPGVTFSQEGLLGGAPTQPGQFPIRVSVTDGALGASADTVLQVNAPPVLGVVPDQLQAHLGQPFSVTFNASDPNNASLTWSLSGALPQGLGFTAQGVLSGTPTQPGQFPLQVGVSDGLVQDTAYTVLDVNAPPVLATPTVVQAVAGQPFAVTFSASDANNDPLVWSLSGALPPSVFFTAGGELSGVAPDEGEIPLQVGVNDGLASAGAWLTLRVNAPPVMAVPAVVQAQWGQPLSQVFSASDGVGAGVAWQVDGALPVGVSFTPQGELTGTPAQAGSFALLLTASDGELSASAATVLRVNAPPVLAAPPAVYAINQGQPFAANLSASDPEGDPLVFSVTGALPAGVAFSSTGDFTGVPGQGGEFPLVVSVGDGGLSASAPTLLRVNAPPVLEMFPGLLLANLSHPFSTALSASDPEGVALTWSVSGSLPVGVGLVDGVISGAPGVAGDFPVDIWVGDGQISASAATVLRVNAPPAFGALPPVLTLSRQVSFSQLLPVLDPDGPPPVISLSGTLPDGVVFDGAGLLGAPTQSGSFALTVLASDGALTGSQSLTLLVDTPPVLLVSPSWVFPLGLPHGVTLNAQDEDGDALAWNVTGALPPGLTWEGTEVSGSAQVSGDFPLVVSVDDGALSASAVVNLRVNSPPVLAALPASFTVSAVAPIALALVQGDANGDALSVSVTGNLPTGVSVVGQNLVGTPGQTGEFPLTVLASDGLNDVSADFTLWVNQPPVVSMDQSVFVVPMGQFFATTAQVSDGDGHTPTGQLAGYKPPGMSTAGFALGGTPQLAGTFSLTWTVNDGWDTATASFTIVVQQTPVIVGPSALTLLRDQAATATWQAVGGQGAVLSISAETALPPGLLLTDGVLGGTPTAEGGYTLVLSASNDVGQTTLSVSLTVVAPATAPATLSLFGQVNRPFATALFMPGQTGVAVTSASALTALPPGVELVGGVLSASPQVAGDYTFSLLVEDGVNPAETVLVSLLVDPVLALENFTYLDQNGLVRVDVTGGPWTVALVSAEPKALDLGPLAAQAVADPALHVATANAQGQVDVRLRGDYFSYANLLVFMRCHAACEERGRVELWRSENALYEQYYNMTTPGGNGYVIVGRGALDLPRQDVFEPPAAYTSPSSWPDLSAYYPVSEPPEVAEAIALMRWQWEQGLFIGPDSMAGTYRDPLVRLAENRAHLWPVLCWNWRQIWLDMATASPNIPQVRYIGLYQYNPGFPDLIANSHAVAEFWAASLGKWVLIDPLYGLLFKKDGNYLGADEIRALVLAGQAQSIERVTPLAAQTAYYYSNPTLAQDYTVSRPLWTAGFNPQGGFDLGYNLFFGGIQYGSPQHQPLGP